MSSVSRSWTARHPAAVARILTLGLASSGVFALLAVFARQNDPDSPAELPPQRIEVRVGNDVETAELTAALEAWLAGDPDLDSEGGLRVVQAPPDTETVPS